MSRKKREYFTDLGGERKKRCACGKVCFDKKTAQTKKNFLENSGGEKLRIYQCDMSDWYHLTRLKY